MSILLNNDIDTEVKTSAAHSLVMIGDKLALQKIVDYLSEPNFHKKLLISPQSVTAFSMLKKSEHDKVVDGMKNWRFLVPFFSDGIPTENIYIEPYLLNILNRFSIISTLNKCKNLNITGILHTNLYSPESSLIREICASTLGCIGDNRAIPPLYARLKDRNDFVRYSSAIALRKLGVNDSEPGMLKIKEELIENIDSPLDEERLKAFNTLAELHFEDCADLYLQKLEESSDIYLQLNSLYGLSQLRDTLAINIIRVKKPEIMEYLNNPKEIVRLLALRVIGYSDFKDRNEILQKVYEQDGSFLVRKTALDLMSIRD